MELMTNQEIFDKVAEALMAQGKPSTNPDGNCSYCSPNGDRCAIGWLVSEDMAKEFEEKFSGMGIDTLMSYGDFEGYDQQFLVALQEAHDDSSQCSSWFNDWRRSMITIAEDYNLNTDILFID